MELSVLLRNPLFSNIKESEIQDVLNFLNASEHQYSKGEAVFYSGTVINQIGIVLEGRIQIENTDFWGNKTILDSLGEGKVFAETYALTKVPLMVDVSATQDTKILFLQTDNITAGKDESSQIITKNILAIYGRLLSYLSSQVPAKAPDAEFDIPFDRQQLADYLEVDRSALSAELSKMKADGLIDYWKNHFKLLNES